MPALAESTWLPVPRHPVPADDDVHVWRIVFDRLEACAPQLEAQLAPEERARADRFHFETNRREYVLSHALLRQILSRYLSVEPAHLSFATSARGRPEVGPKLNPRHLRFNLSHTRGVALIAVTFQRDVGVDVESFRPVMEAELIAEQFFSSRERDRLRLLPAEQKQLAFFNCWTRREAYLKATGEGIAESLDQIEVTFAPGEPVRLLSVRGDRQEAARWQLQELSPGPGYVAALAVQGQGLKVFQWDWAGGPASAEDPARRAGHR